MKLHKLISTNNPMQAKIVPISNLIQQEVSQNINIFIPNERGWKQNEQNSYFEYYPVASTRNTLGKKENSTTFCAKRRTNLKNIDLL